jgi:hypothetical protein
MLHSHINEHRPRTFSWAFAFEQKNLLLLAGGDDLNNWTRGSTGWPAKEQWDQIRTFQQKEKKRASTKVPLRVVCAGWGDGDGD